MPLNQESDNHTGSVSQKTGDLVFKTRLLLIGEDEGISALELAKKLDISVSAAKRYITHAGGYSVKRGKWQADPTPEEIEFAMAIIRRLPVVPTR